MTNLRNKTLIIGKNSYIGSNLYTSYKKLCSDIIGTTRNDISDPYYFDLLSPDISHFNLENYKWAIICASIPNVAKCENEKELSFSLNVTGTINLIKQLHEKGVKIIFLSSDYVFDGEKGNYKENDTVSPISNYGVHKAIVEKEIPNICGTNFLILRLSKIFSLQPDSTLLFEMINKWEKHQIVSAAYDQIFSPLLIDDLFSIIYLLQEKNASGIFHVCSNAAWSRYDIAILLANKLKTNLNLLKKISLDELNETFKRPKNTSMNNSKLTKLLNYKTKSIQTLIEQSF